MNKWCLVAILGFTSNDLICCQSNDSLLSIGRHYWYNISKDMDCKDFYPMFLLYNKKERLTGFGWVSMGRAESSRYEHPPPNRLSVSIRIELDYIEFLQYFMTYRPIHSNFSLRNRKPPSHNQPRCSPLYLLVYRSIGLRYLCSFTEPIPNSKPFLRF